MRHETRYYFYAPESEFVRWATAKEYEAFALRLEDKDFDDPTWFDLEYIDGEPWEIRGQVRCREIESPVLPPASGPVHADVEAYTIVSALREASADVEQLVPVDVEGERLVQLIPHREKHGWWRVALQGAREGEWHHLGWFEKYEIRIPLQITLREATISYLRDAGCPRIPGGVDRLSEGVAHWALEWVLPMEPKMWSGAPIDAKEFEEWCDARFKNEDALASILSTNRSTVNRWKAGGVPKGTSAYAVRSLMDQPTFGGWRGEERELEKFREQFIHELSVNK